MKKTMILMSLTLIGLWAICAEAAQPRAALIIGNAAYQGIPLTNPVNDARDMADALKRLGFAVTLLTEADRRSMIEAIQAFGDTLTDGSAALVYFSGHGLQSQGSNYLIPLGANIKKEADIEFETVDANRILAHLQEANGKGVNMLILDACRDNPFKGFMKSAKSGLAQMDAPTGSLIVYATAPNTAALDDPNGKNSIYTRRLLDALRETPTLNVLEMLIRVRKQVMKDTSDRQLPWEAGSLTDLFYFADAAPTPPPVPAETPTPQIVYVEVTPTPQPEQPTPTPQIVYVEVTPTPRASTPLSVTSCWRNETPGATCKEPTTGMEFVYVPGGKFEMGCGKKEQGCSNDEKPRHKVKVNGFWIGKYEVTQAQWVAIMGNNPSYFKGADYPVEQVSWNDAQAFLKKLNVTPSQSPLNQGGQRRVFRLPTEAEWEYAARAKTQTAYSFGDDPSQLNNYAWHSANSGGTTHSVGQKQPNKFGLYDMHGNVWEWVTDTYHKNYKDSPKDDSAWVGGGSFRVLRGGSWYFVPKSVRSANRGNYGPADRYGYIGFRVVAVSR